MTCCEGPKCRAEPGDPRHGKHSTYINWGCRCADCREAKRQYEIRRRHARGQRPWSEWLEELAKRPGPAHGTITAYSRGCRCDDCRRAQAAYQRGRAK